MKLNLTLNADQALAFRKAMDNVEWPSSAAHFARTLLASAADCVAVAKDIPLPLVFEVRPPTREERAAREVLCHPTASGQE